MIRPAPFGAVLALLAGCGSPATPVAAPPSASPAPGRLAPRSCAETPYGTHPGAEAPVAVRAGGRVRIGITLHKGSGYALVEEARVELLPRGLSPLAAPGKADPALVRHADAVRRVERSALPPGEHDLTFTFDGTDDQGRRLAPGTYAAVFMIRSSPNPGSGCDGPPAGASGVLTTLDWRG